MISLGQLGSSSLLLALAFAIYAVIAGVLGVIRRDARLLTSARYTAIAVFLATTAALAAMETALLLDDFSIEYVAKHSSPVAPIWVKVVMLWGSLEGSILLWAWLLTGYTALLALTAPNTILRPWALVIMQMVQIFFVGISATIANPFKLVPDAQYLGPGLIPFYKTTG